MNTEKKIITIEIDYIRIAEVSSIELEKLISILEVFRVKSNSLTNPKVEIYTSVDDYGKVEYTSITLLADRLETDKEFKYRLELEERIEREKADKEKRELEYKKKLYESLKKELEKEG